MKTIIKPIILLIIIVGFVSLLTNCRKDTDCIAIITVKKQGTIANNFIDTNIVFPNAKVTLIKGNSPATNITGVTDVNGQFKHTFALLAILNVTAILFKKDSATADSLTGSAIIQLVVGGTAYKTVFIK